MSYFAIRKYFISRLTKQGLSEHGDMEFKSDVSVTNKFIFRVPETLGEGPTDVSRFHPRRQVEIHLAVKLVDSKAQQADYTNMQLKIEQLLKELPNPTNFQVAGFGLRLVRFISCVENLESSIMKFTLTFEVEDELTYA
jgi:hypothetical protein